MAALSLLLLQLCCACSGELAEASMPANAGASTSCDADVNQLRAEAAAWLASESGARAQYYGKRAHKLAQESAELASRGEDGFLPAFEATNQPVHRSAYTIHSRESASVALCSPLHSLTFGSVASAPGSLRCSS